MLDHYYRINVRLCGGAYNGVEKEFELNITPGEVLNITERGKGSQVYVLMNGPAVALAISTGRSSTTLWANAIHVASLPEIRGLLQN